MATFVSEHTGKVGEEKVNSPVAKLTVFVLPFSKCTVTVRIDTSKSPTELLHPGRRVQHQKTKFRRRCHLGIMGFNFEPIEGNFVKEGGGGEFSKIRQPWKV